jgi:hypothetical protein
LFPFTFMISVIARQYCVNELLAASAFCVNIVFFLYCYFCNYWLGQFSVIGLCINSIHTTQTKAWTFLTGFALMEANKDWESPTLDKNNISSCNEVTHPWSLQKHRLSLNWSFNMTGHTSYNYLNINENQKLFKKGYWK